MTQYLERSRGFINACCVDAYESESCWTLCPDIGSINYMLCIVCNIVYMKGYYSLVLSQMDCKLFLAKAAS